MATANDIIKAAFRIGGITAKGETPDAEDTQNALSTLNDLIDSISNDSLFVFARTLENFTTTAGQIQYSMGVGGDFNTSRPTAIVSAYVRSGDIDYNLESVTDEEYANISLKNTRSIPYFLNYSSTYPLGTLKLYPAPGSDYELYLLTEKPLDVLTLNQELSLPPGWGRYLKNQLALEVCAEFGVAPPQTAVQIAFDAMGKIKRASARVRTMDSTPSASQDNIYSGWNN